MPRIDGRGLPSWTIELEDATVRAAAERLRETVTAALSSGRATTRRSAPAAEPADLHVVCVDHPASAGQLAAWAGPGTAVLLVGPTLQRADIEGRLADAAGLLVAGPTAAHDIRVRPAVPEVAAALPDDHAHRGPGHAGRHLHLHDRVLRLDKAADDVEVLATAHVALRAHPVATWRPSSRTGVLTLGTSAEALSAPTTLRLLLQLARRASGRPAPDPVRVGLLGYGAIGPEHSRAIAATPGLELTAVCDRVEERVATALAYDPAARAFRDADTMLAEADVDLVVVSTPPRTHADWALRVVDSGRHVVVEKPFAIRTADADAVLDAARRRGRLAVVYQNRRFDPDHLALQRLVRAGALGTVFHLEAFVGGYGHPCNLWHSDEDVSGGAVYDWGAHVLDQVLDLLPGPVEYVSASAHKLQWFDVTNADHARVLLRFASGAEAEFVVSDLAAALKPRWYVLGTSGAVVGSWRYERVVGRTDVGTLHEDVLAPADSPPQLDLYAPDGSVTRVATPPGPSYAFHVELAEHLTLGLPMSVTGEQSRRVLAVMEAAAESARENGRPVVPR